MGTRPHYGYCNLFCCRRSNYLLGYAKVNYNMMSELRTFLCGKRNMPMSSVITPESRIFRIGQECYIAYLGNDRNDVRPFLRVGNTKNIPNEVHEVVNTTVISDDHVGNPLQEILVANQFHGKYLGDTGVVATIRRFFRSFDLPVDDVADYRQIKDGERRHMVWFYSSGNLHLRYDDRIIFNLRRRERDDRHFVQLYEEAKAEFLRNPLRYIRQDFSGTGMVLSGGNAFWYEEGDFLSLEAHPGFIAMLMSQGIDPDFINTAAYNLSPDSMDSPDSAIFVGFLKRIRQRHKKLRVITSKPELMRKLRLLFPKRLDTPSSLDLVDVSDKQKAMFHESIVISREDEWQLHRSGLPPISTHRDFQKGIAVDVENGVLIFNNGEIEEKFRLLPGFPVEFLAQDVPEQQLIERYLGYTMRNMRDLLSGEETQAVSAIEKYLRLLTEFITAEQSTQPTSLKHSASDVRDILQHYDPAGNTLSWFLFSNAHSIHERLRLRLPEERGIQRSSDQVAGVLQNLLDRGPHPDPILPFFGDFYLGGRPCLLWGTTKRGCGVVDIAAAKGINTHIAKISTLDETPWNEDLERLLRLIRSLRNAGAGSLTDEELKLLKTPESAKDEARRHQQKKDTVSEVSQSRQGRSDIQGTEVKISPVRTRRPARRKKKWPWILLILLLLLVGGAVAWDLSGSAPWGRMLPWGKTVLGKSEFLDGRETEDGAADGLTEELADDAPDQKTDTADQTPGIVIDADVPPKTIEEVRAYLNVAERVNITEVDIHLAANEIAVLNGYKDLDYKVFIGSDPDWIYPGTVLELPGAGNHHVTEGDTIWFLAARRLRIDAEGNLAKHDDAVAVLKDRSSDASERDSAVESLRRIVAESKVAAMRGMAETAILLDQ